MSTISADERTRADELKRLTLIAAARVDAATLSKEPFLYSTKWFDYRFLHPLECTELFVDAYIDVFQQKWSRNISTKDASLKRGTRRAGWVSDQREFTSFWRARQYADELCMPYRWFVEHAMEHVLRIGYTRIPRPNQLFSHKQGEAMAENAANQWLEWCSTAKLEYSDLPQYKLENFRATPFQNDHMEWILCVLRERHSDPREIGRLISQNVLPNHMAGFEFGPHHLELAARSMTPPPPMEHLEEHRLRPGCFGVVHCYPSASNECVACPFAAECRDAASATRMELIDEHGADDPVAARKRELGKKRVQKLRDKRRREKDVIPLLEPSNYLLPTSQSGA